MKKILENLISGKKVLILGFGREGKSTYNLLKQIGKYGDLAIADQNELDVDKKVKTFFGKNYMDSIKEYDVIFKSPGVVMPKNVDLTKKIVTSEIEMFLKKYRNQIIGITGTKGKSTTTSLIYHILKENNKKCLLAGNIGIPVFDKIDLIDEDTIIVIELSCHQLENCKYSPTKAVFLNIYEDHLDHYDNFEKYYEAKKNIYKNQNEKDVIFYGLNINIEKEIKSKKIFVDKNNLPFENFEDVGLKIQGEHNKYNFSVAYEVVKQYAINEKDFINAIKTFEMLPHRVEFIGNKYGFDFYDDSISTTVESCICAIKSIKNISTVLLGGLDRGINYEKLIDFLNEKKLDNVICMYDSGKRIFEEIKNKNFDINVILVKDLDEAIEKSVEKTKKDGAILLSPASASYGYFKNFEERGNYFKKKIFEK